MKPLSTARWMLALAGIASALLVLRVPAQVKTAPGGASAKKVPAKKAAATGQFVDVTRASGLEFRLTCGGAEKRYIMESMCGGVAVFDYDGDGWMDIFFTDGSTLEDLHSGKCHTGKLFRNNHDGTFTDTTQRAGLSHCGWGFGAAVGDFDNDGGEDLYVTYLDGGVLYRNNRNGTFTDVTAKAGVGNAGAWGTSAAFGDYDNDGFLDLYVANYVDLDLEHLPEFGVGPFCQYRGIPVSCGPRGLKGGRDRLYHNQGDGTFADVTEKLGIDPQANYGLGVLWLDYDKDGCLDLYVADDSSPSMLYHNDCKGGLAEVGAETGVAYSDDGREQAGMGIDSADYDNDGWPDLVKTNFSDDSNNLYHNEGGKQFTDMAGPSGFGPISIPFLAFGVKFFDFDNDGRADIFVANGHVNPQVDRQSFGVTYAQHPFLFHNLDGKRFESIDAGSAALARKYVGRGAATGDFRNRGEEQVVFTALDGSPVLLENRAAASGHWLRVKTVGTKSNRDGYGAQVEVRTSAGMQYREVRANSSFESASDPRLHFGLGQAARVESITVRWPSGQTEKIGVEAADQELTVEEGKGIVARAPLKPGASAPAAGGKRGAKD